MTRSHRRYLVVGFVLALAALVTDCGGTTTLVRSWRDPSYPSGSLHRPLVVAVANRHELRVRLEDDLVLGMRRLGVEGISSHTLVRDQDLTVAAIKEKLAASERDSVIVTHLLDVQREKVSVASEPAGGAYPAYNDRWGEYYVKTFNAVAEPGYTFERRSYVLETKLYDAKTEKVVWSAVTKTEEPASVNAAIQGLVGVLVDDLNKSRVL